MNYEEIKKQKEYAMTKAMAALTEHFSSFVVMACHTLDDGCTGNIFRWQGNCYACVGMMDTFKDALKEDLYGHEGTDRENLRQEF